MEPAPALLSARAVAVLLSISESTVWKWHAEGKLPAPVKPGGRTLWRRAELLDWVDAGCPARQFWIWKGGRK